MTASLHIYAAELRCGLYTGLEAGGKTIREPMDQAYGERSCGVLDPCGNQWWIARLLHRTLITCPIVGTRGTQAATLRRSLRSSFWWKLSKVEVAALRWISRVGWAAMLLSGRAGLGRHGGGLIQRGA